MELRYLYHFYCVARAGGFRKAADTYRLQQPALSRFVKKLEDDLGVPLFERSRRRIRLTSEGQRIFESCGRIFHETEVIRNVAESERQECKGPLHFAAGSAISTELVPRVNQAILRRFPDLWPMTYCAPARTVLEQIEKAELEFGLFFHLPKLSPRFAVEPLAEPDFHLVVKAGKQRDGKICSSFIGSREIEDPTNKSFPVLLRLRRDFPSARIRISSNDLVAHRQMVLRGLGVSVLPRFLVREDLKRGRLRDLYPKERFRFPLHLLTRRNALLARAATQYLEETKRLAQH